MIIRIQNKAKTDLNNIYKYTYKKWGEKQADKYYDLLSEGIDNLKTHPEIGKEAGDIRAGYRKLQIKHHVVFYKMRDQYIQIIRVLHEDRDFKRHL